MKFWKSTLNKQGHLVEHVQMYLNNLLRWSTLEIQETRGKKQIVTSDEEDAHVEIPLVKRKKMEKTLSNDDSIDDDAIISNVFGKGKGLSPSASKSLSILEKSSSPLPLYLPQLNPLLHPPPPLSLMYDQLHHHHLHKMYNLL